MFYPDLGTETMVGRGPRVRAIGWLEPQHPFTTGTVEASFVSALEHHLRTPWQPVFVMGPHACGFCKPDKPFRASLNLWIPDDEVLFIAPAMVLHYVIAHQYCPPEGFRNAVLACPEQGSGAVFDHLAPSWPEGAASLQRLRVFAGK